MKITVRSIIILLFIFLASMQSAPMASADNGGYTIRDYHVEAKLQKNNVLDITETIQVHFQEKRHGIYRNIPTHMYVNRFTAEDAENKSATSGRVMDYANKIRNLSVDGWEYDTDTENGNYVIRIGDEDTLVEGDQTYQISYRYVMPDDRITYNDFLFYSVLGNGW
ncbi:MAG: DUF2207 domain-containing protein, partial [Lachnospiraceae bacterium]|nr:DUF2207 domain-containing protein [Lachnospiraceae bacterium]